MKPDAPRRVSDVMSRNVIVLHEENDLALAEEGLRKFSFRHLPVIDGNKLVGLVSERDLLRASVSSLDEAYALKDDNLKRYFFVREIMTTEVITVRPETLLLDAARILMEKRIGCLPVTQEDGTLVGILTQGDFVELAGQFLCDAETARRAQPGPPTLPRPA